MYVHTYIHTYIHAYIHTYIHVHTYIHTCTYNIHVHTYMRGKDDSLSPYRFTGFLINNADVFLPVYNDLKYVDVVKHCAQLSMVRAADEIKALHEKERQHIHKMERLVYT